MAFLFPHLRRSSRRFPAVVLVGPGAGPDFAGRFVSRRLSEKYQQILQTKAPVFLTLAFLFPFFPDDLLCILAGLSSLSFRRFAVIVLLARPWGLLFASALGGAAFHVSPWAMVLIGVAGLVLFLSGDEIWGSDRSGHPEAPVPAERAMMRPADAAEIPASLAQ